MKTMLNCDMLRAVSLAVSTEAARYYLTGVFVEISTEHATMVATNGHILLGARHEIANPDMLAAAIIIPFDVIKSFKPLKNQVEVGLEKMAGTRWMLGNTMFEPIDGTFPNWRRVVPADCSELSVEKCWFASKYLAVMAKAAATLGKTSGDGFAIYPAGQKPALVLFDSPDVFGVVMPVRQNRDETGRAPSWAKFTGETK